MRPPSRRTREAMILIFGTTHLLFLLICILPEPWRQVSILPKVCRIYQIITGSKQDWIVFDTIPTFHRLNVRLIVKDEKGRLHEEGILLPGLRRYPEPEQARIYKWVILMSFSSLMPPQRAAYIKKVAAELLRSGRYGPKSEVSLEVTAERTRSLLGVRKLREIAVPSTTLMGPLVLSDLVAKVPDVK